MKGKWVVLGPLAVLAVLLFIAVGGGVVQALWNWLLPSLFGWPRIGFWQGLGLLALCRILFGGWGGSAGSRSRIHDRVSERWDRRVAERVAERMRGMTPEERERFRRRMRERWGLDPSAGESGSGTPAE
jgi:hypothetical protein